MIQPYKSISDTSFHPAPLVGCQKEPYDVPGFNIASTLFPSCPTPGNFRWNKDLMERKKSGNLIFLSLSSGAVVSNNFCYESLRLLPIVLLFICLVSIH